MDISNKLKVMIVFDISNNQYYLSLGKQIFYRGQKNSSNNW